MKTQIINYLLLVSFLLASTSIFAQFPGADRIRRTIINRTVDKAADRAADKAADKIVDGIFGAEDNSTTRTQAQRDSAVTESAKRFGNIMSGITNAAPPKESYSFESSYVMQLNSKNKNEKDQNEMSMKYYFTKNGSYVGSKMNEIKDNSGKKTAPPMSMMVFDFDQSSMYTFMDNDGKKTVFGLGLKNTAAENYTNEKMAETKYTKTGQTKTILGYTCDGYLVESDDSKSTIWISRSNVPVISNYYESFKKMSSSNSGNFKLNYDVNPEIAKMVAKGSAVLGMDSTDKNGNETHMEVTEINSSDNFTFKTTGYQNPMAGGNK